MFRIVSLVGFVVLMFGCSAPNVFHGVADPADQLDAGNPVDAGSAVDAGSLADAGPDGECVGVPSEGDTWPPEPCTPGAWCSMIPRSDEHNWVWESIWPVSPTEAWAFRRPFWSPEAGNFADRKLHLARWDGQQWADFLPHPFPAGTGIWFRNQNDFWIDAENGLRRWDGANFQLFPLNSDSYPYGSWPSLSAAWGDGTGNVWFVGSSGVILHWNGVSISKEAPVVDTNLNTVWGANASDIWVGGDKGVLLHWDGSTWTKQEGPFTGRLDQIDGSGSTNVWITATDGVFRWDGFVWSRMPSKYDGGVVSIAVLGPNAVWSTDVLGEMRFWNGTGWSNTPCGLQMREEMRVLRKDSAGTVWAVDGFASGDWVIQHWNGLNGARPVRGNVSQYADIIVGSGSDDVWLEDVWAPEATPTGEITRYPLFHWDGHEWTLAPSFGDKKWLGAMLSFSSTDTWVVVRGDIQHWDGVNWTPVPEANILAQGTAVGAWGSGPNDVWFSIAGQLLIHWDGAEWTQTSSPAASPLWHGRGARADDFWAWNKTELAHWDGQAWTSRTDWVPTGAETIWDILVSENEAWITYGKRSGTEAVIARWDGAAWQTLPAPTYNGSPVTLRSAALADATSIWALGYASNKKQNVVSRWDADHWMVESAGQGAGEWDWIWAVSPNEIWATGDGVYRLQRAP